MTSLAEQVAQFEREVLSKTLAAFGENHTAAARHLQLALSTYRFKLERYGLWSPNPKVGRLSAWLAVDISTTSLTGNQFRAAVSSLTLCSPLLLRFGVPLRPYHESLRKEASPGLCLICDAPLPRVKGRQPVVCTDRKGGPTETPCEAEYDNTSQRDASYRAWAVKQALMNSICSLILLGVVPAQPAVKKAPVCRPRPSKALRFMKPSPNHPWRQSYSRGTASRPIAKEIR